MCEGFKNGTMLYVASYIYSVNRYWKEASSLGNLNIWLPDNDSVISVHEASKNGKDGTITVQCGSLKCTFGVKTYPYAGHRHRQKHKAAAYTTV